MSKENMKWRLLLYEEHITLERGEFKGYGDARRRFDELVKNHKLTYHGAVGLTNMGMGNSLIAEGHGMTLELWGELSTNKIKGVNNE